MKTFYEIKTISDSVKDVDETSRRVKVVISEMGTLDLDNDVIDPAAYTKTIKERGPNGAKLIWHLTDHNTSLKSAVGKFSELFVEGNQLIGVTDIPNTSWGTDVLEFYKTGAINQHSVGFRTIKSEPVGAGKASEYNLIKEVLLYEGSAVLWAAHPSTPTLAVGKSLTPTEQEDLFTKLNTELTLIFKSLKDGKYTDNSFELLEIRYSQTQEQLKQLLLSKTTQPVGATVEPDVKNDKLLIEQLKSINQLFKN